MYAGCFWTPGVLFVLQNNKAIVLFQIRFNKFLETLYFHEL